MLATLYRWFDSKDEPFYRQTHRSRYFYYMGISATIGYGLLWRYILPQPYENFLFRFLLILVLVIGFVLRYRQNSLDRVRNFVFYALFVAVTTFIFVMYAANGAGNLVWAGTSVCATYMLFGVFRWHTGLIVFLLSVVAAIVTSYALWGTRVFALSTASYEFFGVLIFALATAYNMASDRDLLDQTKTSGAQAALAVLAHEVRSPLFALRAGLFSIESRMAEIDKECIEYSLIDVLNRRIDDVNTTLNFHLKNLQLQGEGLKLSLGNVLIEEVVRDAVETLGFLSADFQISIDVEPGSVVGNKDGIRQVLINLIRNAMAAVRSIGSGSVTVRCTRHGNEYQFSVEDTAATLRAADAARIFEPFVSLRKDAGIGIGLYASKEICAALGTALRVEITSTRTQFFFRLPSATSPMTVPTTTPR